MTGRIYMSHASEQERREAQNPPPGGPVAVADKVTDRAWSLLADELSGRLVRPGDRGYRQAKQVYQRLFSERNPTGVVLCETVADVAAAVRFAGAQGLPVVPRSSGHSLAGWSTSTGVVVDVSRLRRLDVTPSRLRLGPGVRSVDASHALSPHGLAVVSGTCPTVAQAGYALGGGVGLMTRPFGLAADQLTGAEVVLADGRVVTCSAEREPELFWALRGGGCGSFGVVTELSVAPLAVRDVVSLYLAWPWEHAAEVLAGYTAWLADSPHHTGSVFSCLVPDAALTPEPITSVMGMCFGTLAEAEAEVGRLVELAGHRPQVAIAQPQLLHDANLFLWECENLSLEQSAVVGTSPEAVLRRWSFGQSRGEYATRQLSTTDAAGLLAVLTADGGAGQYRALAVLGLGGRTAQVPRGATAYVHRDAGYYIDFLSCLTDRTVDHGVKRELHAWLDLAYGHARRFGVGESYQNFADTSLPDWRKAFYAENYPRLRTVKRAYDPGNVFRSGQTITAGE